MQSLPVDDILPNLQTALAQGNRAVLIAAPGAGKTTRVPPFLAGLNWCTGKVIVLEPRRLAARSAAGFVAQSLGEKPGETVGYRVRLESRVSSRTRIEFVTEGVFARMALDDPELTGISAVVFDEFHERSLDADFGLALALDIQDGLRPDLRIVVMSATLDAAALSKFLDGAPVLESGGRTFPVEIIYRDRGAQERVEDAVAGGILAALRQTSGGVLAFLPGQAEIRRTGERLDGRLPENVQVHPLHGGLDVAEQDDAIRPARTGSRKVVLASAIAETSLTLDGITAIVDSGLARVPRFEPQTGLTRLETVRASRFSIDQRAGRAGRTAPGIAIRLWRAEQTAALQRSPDPEIMQADLSGLWLDCAQWGVSSPLQLRWLDPPPPAALAEARTLLVSLAALDAQDRLTPLGRHMRSLALAPRLAAMVIRAADHGQAEMAARLALLLSERGLGGNSVDLAERLDRLQSDHAPRAAAIRKLAAGMAREAGGSAPNKGEISAGALLSFAYPERIAQTRGDGFRLANGRGASLGEPGRLSKEPWIVVAETSGSASTARIVSAAALSIAEIEALHGNAIVQQRTVEADPQSGAVRGREARRLGQLILSHSPVTPTAEERTQALTAWIRAKGMAALDLGKANESLVARMQFLHETVGEPWPASDEESLLADLEVWLAPFLSTVSAPAQVDHDLLRQALAHRLVSAGLELRALERDAPERYRTPAGSEIALRYENGAAVLPVRVQELYGLATHPVIAGGKLPLTLELLSPAHRPIQITRDLPGFWAGSWAAVRSEMKGRYPKHEWPTDPANAVPTTRAKPRGS